MSLRPVRKYLLRKGKEELSYEAWKTMSDGKRKDHLEEAAFGIMW